MVTLGPAQASAPHVFFSPWENGRNTWLCLSSYITVIKKSKYRRVLGVGKFIRHHETKCLLATVNN